MASYCFRQVRLFWILFLDGVKSKFVANLSTSVFNYPDAPLSIGALNSLSHTGGQNNFAGYIDDLRITKGLALYSQSFVPPSQAVGQSLSGTNETNSTTDFTSLYLPFDSSVTADGSPINHSITANGGVNISSTQAKFGSNSAAFDGSDDQLTFTYNTGQYFGTGDFTVELFAYINGYSSGYFPMIFLGYPGAFGGTAASFGMGFENSGGKLRSNVGGAYIDHNNVSISTGQWLHIVGCRQNGVYRTFVNGELNGSTANTNNIAAGSGDSSIGAARFGGGSGTFYGANGFIDDVRVLNGLAKYTAPFTPPTSAVTATVSQTRNDLAVLYMPFDDLQDKARNHPVTANGNAAVSATQAKFGGKSLFIDASGDFITIPNNGDFNFGTEDFTISMFIRPDDVNTSDQVSSVATIIDNDSNAGTSGAWFSLHQKNAGLTFSSNNGQSSFTTSDCLTAATWHHVAVSRIGNVTTVYCDGVSVGSTSTAGNFSDTATRTLYIGKQNNPSTRRFDGYIDDLLIVKNFGMSFSNAPTAASGGEVIDVATDTRTFSSVWNLNSPEVTEAFKAGTWPSLPVPIAWDTTTAGSDVAISNSDLTAAISGSPASWAGNAAISVGSYSSGKIYFEATISGSPSSGYLRVGVVQNKGSATLTEIQSGSMTTWDSDAPAYTNKSENRSQPNGAAINDGSNTHSNGDVFMWAFDIDNARAYFGRNGSFDLSFDPVNGTGGYDMSSLSGYNSTDPWHILFQNRNSTGTVTLRTAAQAQYLPAGYSYWGTV